MRPSANHAGAFAGGVGFVGLVPLRSHAALPAALLEALGATVNGAGDPLHRTAATIGDRAVLLVCDGFERLIDAAGFLADLSAAFERSWALLSAREQRVLRALAAFVAVRERTETSNARR